MNAIKICSSDDFTLLEGKLIRVIKRKAAKQKAKKAVVKLFGKESIVPYDMAIKEKLIIIRTI